MPRRRRKSRPARGGFEGQCGRLQPRRDSAIVHTSSATVNMLTECWRRYADTVPERAIREAVDLFAPEFIAEVIDEVGRSGRLTEASESFVRFLAHRAVARRRQRLF
jgi:hypothetical protein